MESITPYILAGLGGCFVGVLTGIFWAGGRSAKVDEHETAITKILARQDAEAEKSALFRESVPKIYATKENVNDAETRLGKNMDRVMDKLDSVIGGMGDIKNQLIEVLTQKARA